MNCRHKNAHGEIEPGAWFRHLVDCEEHGPESARAICPAMQPHAAIARAKGKSRNGATADLPDSPHPYIAAVNKLLSQGMTFESAARQAYADDPESWKDFMRKNEEAGLIPPQILCNVSAAKPSPAEILYGDKAALASVAQVSNSAAEEIVATAKGLRADQPERFSTDVAATDAFFHTEDGNAAYQEYRRQLFRGAKSPAQQALDTL